MRSGLFIKITHSSSILPLLPRPTPFSSAYSSASSLAALSPPLLHNMVGLTNSNPAIQSKNQQVVTSGQPKRWLVEESGVPSGWESSLQSPVGLESLSLSSVGTPAAWSESPSLPPSFHPPSTVAYSGRPPLSWRCPMKILCSSTIAHRPKILPTSRSVATHLDMTMTTCHWSPSILD